MKNQPNILKGFEFDSKSNIVCIFQKQRNKPTGIAAFSNDNILLGEYNCENDPSEIEILISNYDPKFILFYCNSDRKIKNIVLHIDKDKIIYLKNFGFVYCELVELLKSYLSSSTLNEVSLNSRVSQIVDGLNDSGLLALNSVLLFLKNRNYSPLKLNFEKLNLDNVLMISQRTLSDLQIFDEKLHPSQVKGKGRSKEGLSLFSFFNKAITTLGKKINRNMFLFPLKNPNSINNRLNCVSDFYSIKQLGLVKKLIEELKKLCDMEKMIADLTKFNINFKVWINLWKTANSFLNIYQLFDQLPKDKFKLLQLNFSKINIQEIQNIIDIISGCLDFYKDDFKPKLKIGISEDMDK